MVEAGGKPYEIYIYEGAQHAFNNDTNDTRYNKEAADLAWSRTIAFFEKHLGSWVRRDTRVRRDTGAPHAEDP